MSQLLDALDAEISAGYLQRYTVIGHSLGGAVALHASKDRIRQAILDKRENPNLFILLNPAVNVDEYKPLDTLISLDRQKPSMVVLQSKGDFALKEAFGWMKDGQRAMGNSWAITHDVARCPRADCTKTEYIPEVMLKHDAIPGCGMTLGTSGWKIRARLQSRLNVKTCPDANMQAVWVLSVTDDIINGHNGILTPDHAIALSEIMGLLDQYRNQIPVSAVTVVEPLPEALPTVQPTETDLLLPPEAGREPKPSGESAPTSIEGELQDNVAKPSDPSTQEQMKANDGPVVEPTSKGE
jgi:pimeloyl-ACP methyl ester carboxylesterase